MKLVNRSGANRAELVNAFTTETLNYQKEAPKENRQRLDDSET
jgi:hypothetical protein